MTSKKLVWDATGSKTYETGVDRGVLYVMSTVEPTVGQYPLGVAWNGLQTVTEKPGGGDITDLYADNVKYLALQAAEKMAATVQAYTYPDEFMACDGMGELIEGAVVGQQPRAVFGLSYRTLIGDDVEGQSKGYRIHLLYGCLAAPSERAYQTVNDSPAAITFSWDVNCTPVPVTGFRPSASLIVDSTLVDEDCLADLEDALYGTDSADPYLPLPDAVKTLLTPAVP